MFEERITNPFLQTYLEYVEDTETPRIMHIWSALCGAGAALGRRVYLPFGITNVHANMCVLLVGPPGVRKSTAINIMKKRLRKSTGVRFAPKDTSGHRQGLIIAMEGNKEDMEDDDMAEISAALIASDLERIGNTSLSIDPRDAHCMFAVASEFSSFIGHNSIDMITFLNEVLDGEDYDYKIRTSENILKEPLLSIIGGTTPTNIQEALPRAAIGHGFTSRIILVHANRKFKRVARPKQPDFKLEQEVDTFFANLFYRTDGEMRESKQAEEFIDYVYDKEIELDDTRFTYYLDRRQQHLLKLSIVLTALKGGTVINREDVEEAHQILAYTEKFMPDALGEYGLNALSEAKQKMIEFLAHVNGPVLETVMWAMMQRDMKLVDFKNAMVELENAGKIMSHHSKEGVVYVYIDKEAEEREAVLKVVAE